MQKEEKINELNIEEVMTKDIISCDYNDLAAKATRIILEKNLLGILVIKDAQPYHMLSCLDLLRLSYEEVFDPNRDFLRMKIASIVKNKEFLSLKPETKIKEALQLMEKNQVQILPVLSGKEIRGIFSISDIVKKL